MSNVTTYSAQRTHWMSSILWCQIIVCSFTYHVYRPIFLFFRCHSCCSPENTIWNNARTCCAWRLLLKALPVTTIKVVEGPCSVSQQATSDIVAKLPAKRFKEKLPASGVQQIIKHISSVSASLSQAYGAKLIEGSGCAYTFDTDNILNHIYKEELYSNLF